MEVKKEVLIKNYNIEKKVYELGRQKVKDLSRNGLVSLLNELPAFDHYLRIEIKTINIDIKKIGPNHYSYKLFHRNLLLTKKNNVEFQSLLEVIDKLGMFNNTIPFHKKNLSEIKFLGHKIYKYFSNLMVIILGIVLAVLFIFIYNGIILIKEFSFYEHFYFIFIIVVSIYSVGSSIIKFINRVKKRVLNYEAPIIGEFTSYNASTHILQLTTSIGLGFFIISLLPVVSFENFFRLIAVIILVNFPNLHDLYNNYSKSKKKKMEVLLFLSKYLQLNAINSFEENYIFSTLITLNNKKILNFTLSNKLISALVLILSILSPLF